MKRISNRSFNIYFSEYSHPHYSTMLCKVESSFHLINDRKKNSLLHCYWDNSSLNVIFAMQLTIKLSKVNFSITTVHLHDNENYLETINSPPKKVIQTNNFVHYVLFRHLFFSTTIWIQNHSQSSSVFLYNVFFEKLFMSYYIFLLLEFNTICNLNYHYKLNLWNKVGNF